MNTSNRTEVVKTATNVLIKTENGEYHFSREEYRKLGKQKAIKFAEKEIEKKSKAEYINKTINFNQARELGFCEYGIKDFVSELGLDIDSEYSIDALNKKLTLGVLSKYPDECLKLFGKDCIKYLGTVKELISVDTIDLFLREEFISARKLHQLSVKFAYSCLSNYEDAYPDDNRVRNAIEVKERWIKEKIKLGVI